MSPPISARMGPLVKRSFDLTISFYKELSARSMLEVLYPACRAKTLSNATVLSRLLVSGRTSSFVTKFPFTVGPRYGRTHLPFGVGPSIAPATSTLEQEFTIASDFQVYRRSSTVSRRFD